MNCWLHTADQWWDWIHFWKRVFSFCFHTDKITFQSIKFIGEWFYFNRDILGFMWFRFPGKTIVFVDTFQNLSWQFLIKVDFFSLFFLFYQKRRPCDNIPMTLAKSQLTGFSRLSDSTWVLRLLASSLLQLSQSGHFWRIFPNAKTHVHQLIFWGQQWWCLGSSATFYEVSYQDWPL